ncbi:MAG: OmpA/MotB family protein [Planctomycetota bacterium]|jgi:chemotaxis protein MotB
MIKKRKKNVPGAPAWMITYGDMVTLLLTFFVFLASMANYDDFNNKFMTAIQSIRQAMGMQDRSDKATDSMVDFDKLMVKLESVVETEPAPKPGTAKKLGIERKHFLLRRIRDGMQITMGGPVLFEPFSARLSEEGAELIRFIGQELKGRRNKIEIRGHAADEPQPVDWSYDDSMKLSYRRAEAVANELMLRGVDPRAIVLEAAGANEPVAHLSQDTNKRSANRRVEIIIRESLIDDYAGRLPTINAEAQKPTTQPATTW